MVSPRRDATKSVEDRVEIHISEVPRAEGVTASPGLRTCASWPTWKGRSCELFRESADRTRKEEDEDKATRTVCGCSFLIS